MYGMNQYTSGWNDTVDIHQYNIISCTNHPLHHHLALELNLAPVGAGQESYSITITYMVNTKEK